MSNKKKLSPRRAATFVAALGMLVMSSGAALMVTASPASAKEPVNICHATSSDSNPYVFITVDDDSVKFRGHLMHRNDPNKRWKSAGTFNGEDHVANQAKPDLIGSYTDSDGVLHEMDGDITAASCEAQNPPEVLTAVADVDFTDPTCETPEGADFDITEANATHVVEGSAAPGQHIKITFTANENAAFEEDAQTVFEHDFPSLDDCNPEPPVVVTPVEPTFVEPTCDTDPQVILPEPTEQGPIERKADLIDEQDIDGVHYVVTGVLAPGGTVDVDATAIPPAELAEGAQTHWSYTFAEVGDCDVAPPTTEPPATEPPGGETVVTPTVVHAGLVSDASQDLRTEQGLALLVTGMIMMVVAGGLGIRRTASER